jgi:DAK2 domain fusion protein YloV
VTKSAKVIDASVLRRAMSRFSEALDAHREEIDSLNVFPVPDGDTGTNMALTQRSVSEAVAAAGDVTLEEVGRIVARAALMGARGNSGVILAQVLRGLCDRLCQEPTPASRALAEAIGRGSDEARRGVARPVEGTALTVLAAAADAALERAGAGAGPASVADAALEAARAASAKTRDMLPELRDAGVVDAGGRGMILLFDALSAAIHDGDLTEGAGPSGPVGRTAEVETPSLEQRFEVTYLWEGEDDALPDVTEALGEAGDSVVVVGGGGLFKVHVHTNEPDVVQAAGAEAGSVRDVRVVDLEREVAEQCVAGQARAVRAAERHACELVAVAEGEGLAELFSSLGATVVPGGPGNNPSVAELVKGIETASAASVFMLPNHSNIEPAAREAAAESAKEVVVVPARSIPAGLSAAAAFNPFDSARDNERSMADAVRGATGIEITVAARDAMTAGGSVRKGEWLGLVDGDLAEAGSDPAEIAGKLVARLRSEDHEILTLIVGADPTDEEAARMADALRDAAPGLEVETHRGGQPHSQYLIGLE